MAINPLMNSLQGNMFNPIGGFGQAKKPLTPTKPIVPPQQVAQSSNLGNIRAIPQVQSTAPILPQIDINHSFGPQLTPGVQQIDIGKGSTITPTQFKEDIRQLPKQITSQAIQSKQIDGSQLKVVLDQLPAASRSQYVQSLMDQGVNIQTNKYEKPQDIINIESKRASERTKEEQIALQEHRNRVDLPQRALGTLQGLADVGGWIGKGLDKLFGVDAETEKKIDEQQRKVLFGDVAKTEAFKGGEEFGTIAGTAALTAPFGGAMGGVKSAMAVGSALGVTDYLIYKGVKEEDPDMMEALLAGTLGGFIPGGIAAVKPTKALIQKRVGKTSEIDDIIKKVIQGQDADVGNATKALQLIDVEDIQDYKGLGNAMGARKSSVIALQDEYLAELGQEIITPQTAKTSITAKTIDGEEISTSVDFVERALDDLTEIYTKQGDDIGLEVINAARNKYTTKGLSLQEVNTLARKYNTDTPKAFSKIGDPLTSVSAVRTEATRKGLKTTVRDRLPNDGLKQLDEAYYALSDTQILVDKAVKGVQNLQNKLPDNRLFTQAAAKLVEILDMFSLGLVKGAAKGLLGSNVGQKTMNWGNLQEVLNKNLKAIQKVVGKKDITLKDLTDIEKSLQSGIKGSITTKVSSSKPAINATEDIADNVPTNNDLNIEGVNNPIRPKGVTPPIKPGPFNKAGTATKPTIKSSSDEVLQYTKENLDTIKGQYRETEGNKIIDLDAVRKYLGEKEGVDSSTSQAAASLVTKSLIEDAQKTVPKGSKVLLMGGGSGVGKGTMSRQGMLGDIQDYGFVLDKTLSKFDETKKLYNDLIKRGFNPEVKFVYNSQEASWKNVIKRYVGMKEQSGYGRSVPFKKAFEPIHEGYVDTMVKLKKEGIPFDIVVNGEKPFKVTSKDLESVIKDNKKLTRAEAKSKVQEYIKKGDLTQAELTKFMSLLVMIGLGTYFMGGEGEA